MILSFGYDKDIFIEDYNVTEILITRRPIETDNTNNITVNLHHINIYTSPMSRPIDLSYESRLYKTLQQCMTRASLTTRFIMPYRL